MINALPNTIWVYAVCLCIAVYAAGIGFAWGQISRQVLFKKFSDQYTQFDVACVGLGALISIMLFEWGIRAPFIFVVFHHVQIGGWIVQIWIVCFASGIMGGYAKRKRRSNNLLDGDTQAPATLVHKVCADCPYIKAPKGNP